MYQGAEDYYRSEFKRPKRPNEIEEMTHIYFAEERLRKEREKQERGSFFTRFLNFWKR